MRGVCFEALPRKRITVHSDQFLPFLGIFGISLLGTGKPSTSKLNPTILLWMNHPFVFKKGDDLNRSTIETSRRRFTHHPPLKLSSNITENFINGTINDLYGYLIKLPFLIFELKDLIL
jgi:hypothetical protein